MAMKCNTFLLLSSCGILQVFGLRLSHQPPMDENSWTELDGTSYMASFEDHAAKYPEACKSPIDDDVPGQSRVCPAERLNKIYANSPVWNSPAWDSKGLLKRLAGKTVLFIGDSSVRQLFTRSVCMYAEHIVHLNYNRLMVSAWHEVTFRVDGQNITFLNRWYADPEPRSLGNHEKYQELTEKIKSADIAVLSTGAFQNSKQSMLNAVQRWHQLLAEKKLLYLEYPAAHFPSVSGDYEKGPWYYQPKKDINKVATGINISENPGAYVCQAIDVDAWEASEESFRVFTANEYFRNQSVPIVYGFYATAPVHEQHKGGIDCRHFCNPSPVLDMRINKLDEAIKELLK